MPLYAFAIVAPYIYHLHLPLLLLLLLQSRGTENAYAAARGGEFGTGYHFGGSQLRAITYRNRVEGDPNRVVNKDDEEGDGKGKPAMG
jgi:hypothetical protein